MPEVSEELFAALVAGNAEQIAKIIEEKPVTLPKKSSGLDSWWDKIQDDNRQLAKAYGVEVNEQGASLGPEVAAITAQVRNYYLTHPQDRFIQKSYTELIREEKILPYVEKTQIPTITTIQAVDALAKLDNDKLFLILEILKKGEEKGVAVREEAESQKNTQA